MGEIIALTGDLSTDDRQLIEGYLAWNWDLVGNLPDVHPYKTDGSLFIPAPDPIPEPSTAILAGLGLMGICFRRRRKAFNNQ